jgi:hypothetical protein
MSGVCPACVWRACLGRQAPLKPAIGPKDRQPMQVQAIIAILIFVAALGALNYYEFGRLD